MDSDDKLLVADRIVFYVMVAIALAFLVGAIQ